MPERTASSPASPASPVRMVASRCFASEAPRAPARSPMRAHDHPLPSSSAFSPGSTSGEKAEMARRTRRGRPRRGSAAREDKESRRILIFPPAGEPAKGCERPDSQGILVFPFRTTPRRSRRGRRGCARLSEGDGHVRAFFGDSPSVRTAGARWFRRRGSWHWTRHASRGRRGQAQA